MSIKLTTAKTSANAFIVRFEEPLPPICMLNSRYSHATVAQEIQEISLNEKTPKAKQFPKTVIPALKHEARSYFSLLSSPSDTPHANYLRYPRPKKPIASSNRELDLYFVSNGRVKRKENLLRPLSKDSDDTEILPYRSRTKARPDLTGLREMIRESAGLRATLGKLNRELVDYTNKCYLLGRAKANTVRASPALRSESVSPDSMAASWQLKSPPHN